MSGPRGLGLGAFLAAAFLLAYFAARQLGVPPAICEVMVCLPAAWAAVVLGRRALRTLGPERRFCALLATSALAWTAGQLLWARAVAQNQDPALEPDPLLDLFFVGFVVPALAAALLGPGPRLFRPDALDRADATLGIVALFFVFLRLVFLPNIGASGLQDLRSLLLASLCLALASLASARFFFADEASVRRDYGLLVFFAVTYGVGSAIANGIGPMPPPGSLFDLAWFVPFFLLAAIASPGGRQWERLPSWGVVLLVGSLPLVVDVASHWLWPESRPALDLPAVLTFAALVGIGCAIRLGLQESRDEAARTRDLERLEEERRSGRLDSLSTATGPLVAALRRAVEMLAFRALNAETALGSEAPLVRQQVERALGLTREIEAALGRGHLDPQRVVDVARLLERTLQAELDAGLPIRVRMIARTLPPVVAEPRSLAAAFRELARNAAQASPGGTLEVRGEREPGALVLRFADDGPGVPEEIRASVFDPFFTTGRAGAGVGLGLTLVHFVARELGGSVRLEPGGGGGAAFVMRLPLADRRTPGHGRPSGRDADSIDGGRGHRRLDHVEAGVGQSARPGGRQPRRFHRCLRVAPCGALGGNAHALFPPRPGCPRGGSRASLRRPRVADTGGLALGGRGPASAGRRGRDRPGRPPCRRHSRPRRISGGPHGLRRPAHAGAGRGLLAHIGLRRRDSSASASRPPPLFSRHGRRALRPAARLSPSRWPSGSGRRERRQAPGSTIWLPPAPSASETSPSSCLSCSWAASVGTKRGAGAAPSCPPKPRRWLATSRPARPGDPVIRCEALRASEAARTCRSPRRMKGTFWLMMRRPSKSHDGSEEQGRHAERTKSGRR